MENPSAGGMVTRNMRPGLIAFGIFSVFLGVLCLLMVPLMVFGATIKPPGGQPASSMSMVIPAAFFYLGLAVVNIWLGVGSILCRRWARALMLLYSLFWLIAGLVSFVMVMVFAGDMKAAVFQSAGSASPAMASGILTVMFGVMAIIYVVIPGAFTAFYALRSTRLTCEARDSKIRWTDRCPLPLLGLVLLHAFMAVCLPSILLYTPMFAFFGKWLQGPAAVVAVLGFSGLFAYCAWGMYFRNRLCWALALGGWLLVATSYMVTLCKTGLMELYRHMDMPAESLKILEQMPMLQNKSLAWLGLLYVIPYLAWMIWSLRYFKQTDEGNPR